MDRLNILLIDDDPNDRALVIRELRKDFEIEINEIYDQKGLVKQLDNFDFDIVITDYHLKWSTGLDILNSIKSVHPDMPVIMFTGTGNEEIAVEAMKAGLDDYVVKSPKHFKRLVGAVKLALNRSEERRERQKFQSAFHVSEEKFKNIFNSSPNAIAVTDLDSTIIECNEALLELNGFSKKSELLGKSAIDLVASRDKPRILDSFKKCLAGHSVKNVELSFIKKNNEELPVEVSTGLISDISGKPIYIVTIGKDITLRKKAEFEMKKRMMKFVIDDGKLYLVKETLPSVSNEAFLDLLNVGYHGTIITRIPKKNISKALFEYEFDFYWLADKESDDIDGDPVIKPNLKNLEYLIEALPTKNVILIERLDYLIFKNGFKKTLFFIQHLREFAYMTNNVIIISLDPQTLTRQDLALLEKECSKIEPKLNKRRLSSELQSILKIIYQNNSEGIKPTYLMLGQTLGLSKPTIRKRVRALLSMGYIIETQKGRSKVVELTDFGRSSFFT